MDLKVFIEDRTVINVPKNDEDLKSELSRRTGLDPEDFYLIQNGKILSNLRGVDDSQNIRLCIRALGGKGGFGSMLRAIGAQIEKTTNREACRDLSGRRLRDINEEKRLKAWLEKQKDKEAEAEEKRKKKLEKLMAVPKHEFKDSEYEAARSELTEKVSEAVEEGFKKAALKPKDPVALKRKAEDNGSATKAKKAALWLGDDLNSSTDSDEDSEDADDSEGSERSKSSKSNESSASSGSKSGSN